MNGSVRLCWFTVTFKHAAEKEKKNKLLQVLGNLPPETGEFLSRILLYYA